jgi:hypothetical protein
MKIILLYFLYTIVVPLTELENRQRLFESLSRITFRGVWKSDDPIYHFDNKEGTVEILFQFVINYRRTKEYLYNYYLFLNDGEFKDKWLLIQNRSPQTLNQSLITESDEYIILTEQGFNASIFEMETLQPILRAHKKIDLSFKIDADTKIFMPFYRNMTGTIELKDINKKIEFKAVTDNIFLKISNFSICISIIGLMQLFNSKQLVERLEANPSDAKRVKTINLVLTICIFYKYCLECFSGICLFLSFVI